MEADLAQQQAKLELETRKAVDELRDRRNREQHLNTVELHRVAEEVATVQQRKEDLAGQFQTCSICMDDEVALVDGYLCDNAAGEKHFTCDGCFTHHVKTKMEEDLRLLEAHGAAVFCPCKTPQLACESSAVAVEDLFRHAPDAFQAHLAARQRVLEKRLTEDIRREERTRMEEEQARLARLGALERRIHDARTTMTEDLLTLKCPRRDCAQAFVDFDGCFALTCGRCGCIIEQERISEPCAYALDKSKTFVFATYPCTTTRLSGVSRSVRWVSDQRGAQEYGVESKLPY